MLAKIHALFLIERQAREAGSSFDQRYALRQQQAQPILHEIKTWLDQQGTQVLPKIAIGKAFGYTMVKVGKIHQRWPFGD